MALVARYLRESGLPQQIWPLLKRLSPSLAQVAEVDIHGRHINWPQGNREYSQESLSRLPVEETDTDTEGLPDRFLQWRGPEPGCPEDSEPEKLGAPYRSSSNTISQPQFSPPHRRAPEGEIRVGAETDIRMTGGAIANTLRKQKTCNVLAGGRDAVNQAVKALAVARNYLKDRMEGDVWFQPNHMYRHDRKTVNQIVFVTKGVGGTLSVGDDVEVLRCKSGLHVLHLASATSAALKQKSVAIVSSIGIGAVTTAVISLTWARRFLIKDGLDLECYPEFVKIAMPDKQEIHGIHLVCRLGESATNASSDDLDYLAAIHHLGFSIPMDELQSSKDAFSTFVTRSLPHIKVAMTSKANALASVAVSQLRFHPGVQLLSCGEHAGNVAFKTLCIARTYVREREGYDLGLQCIHAPRLSVDGNAQLAIWGLLVKAEASKEMREFKVNNIQSAKIIGGACVHHLRKGNQVALVGMGISCVSKMLVTLSFARSFIEKDGLDIVGFPGFEDFVSKKDDGSAVDCVRLKMGLLVFSKNNSGEEDSPEETEGSPT